MTAYIYMAMAWCSNMENTRKNPKKRVEILSFRPLIFNFFIAVAGSGSATGAWEGSPGQKAPLVASDSSSSGGSDSEEDPGENKTQGSPKTPANQTTAPSR